MEDGTQKANNGDVEQPPVTARPEVRLIGNDGNAFFVLGACKRAARKAGWTQAEWEHVRDKMTSGDYDNLLGVAMEHFDVV